MITSGPILVTGGAGYIGSHVILSLLDEGYEVVVADNLSTGFRQSVDSRAKLEIGDVGDFDFIKDVIERNSIDAVMHFAGSIVVPESVVDPLKYYRNNTSTSRVLIDACVTCGVGTFVFSSTAAVYGQPDVVPISEDGVLGPINPYGRSKLMTEQVLADVALAHDFKYAALRYFNVAGADPQGRIGQSTPEATHLIKVAAEAVVGKREQIAIFGTDYPTPDGTCLRDYIHVSDLADAHVKVLGSLKNGSQNLTLNCGYGRGFSVREVLETVQRVSDTKLTIIESPRRAGDPPELVANAIEIKKQVGWQPKYDDLDLIAKSAVEWERKLFALNDKR